MASHFRARQFADASITKVKVDRSVFDLRVVEVTSSYAISNKDELIYVSSEGGATLTLPALSTQNGRELAVKDAGFANVGGPILIEPAGAETIDGGPSLTLTGNYDRVTLVGRSSTDWSIVSLRISESPSPPILAQNVDGLEGWLGNPILSLSPELGTQDYQEFVSQDAQNVEGLAGWHENLIVSLSQELGYQDYQEFVSQRAQNVDGHPRIIGAITT